MASTTSTITVAGTSDGPKRTRIETGTGEFVVGDASPLEHLLGSLAACLNVIGHLVAREQGLTLRGVAVDVEGDIDTRRYKGKETDARAGFESIRVRVRADTDADDAAVAAWLEEVETRCPVADNLHTGTALSVDIDG